MSKAVVLGRVNLPYKGSDGVTRMYSQRPNPSFAYKAPDGKAFATSDERRKYMNDPRAVHVKDPRRIKK